MHPETASPPQPSTPRVTYRQVRFERTAGSTEILLVRHGESAEADSGRSPFPLVDGPGRPELSPLGRRQADALARTARGPRDRRAST